MRNDAFCGIMPEIAAEKKGSRNPEVPADIVILFVLMIYPFYYHGECIVHFPCSARLAIIDKERTKKHENAID